MLDGFRLPPQIVNPTTSVYTTILECQYMLYMCSSIRSTHRHCIVSPFMNVVLISATWGCLTYLLTSGGNVCSL